MMSRVVFAVNAVLCASTVLADTFKVGGPDLAITVDAATGVYTVDVDGAPWVPSGPALLPPTASVPVSAKTANGSDPQGDYTSLTIGWGSHTAAPPTYEWTFTGYTDHQMLVFTQRFTAGFNSSAPPPPSPPTPASCGVILNHTDQVHGNMISRSPFVSNSECCDRCIKNPDCDAWSAGPETSAPHAVECYLLKGNKATEPRADRTLGIVRGGPPPPSSGPFLATFPTVSTNSSTPLRYISFGGCQCKSPTNGAWGSTATQFDGATSGEPLVLHNSEASPRAIVMAPIDNFMVSGQATLGDVVGCGIRSTVKSLPPQFEHSTVIVGGRGINRTLFALGDLLLSKGGKQRTDPESDFVLSHAGYWTDHGAFYYHSDSGFSNAEAALKAVKTDLKQRNIPLRYFQWDDWWMESNGDVPGMTSWTPIPTKFPSGFTDWLGSPLSLYAPMYAANNDWVSAYEWKIDALHNRSAIPLDPKFYPDLFANGTKIGMKMFEQDFLCSTNTGTSLTNSDLKSGQQWLDNMNSAAEEAGITVQWCMINPQHALASTRASRVTNSRGTADNTRNTATNIEPMGQNSLLYFALGMFTSRDNVFTTPSNVEQTGCSGGHCVEPTRHADNAVAFLAGGPYGPSDGVGLTDRSIVMRTCRADGVLLRPSLPLATLDLAFTKPTGKPNDNSAAPLWWAAHDNHGALRWSYFLSINSDGAVSVDPATLLWEDAAAAMAAWVVDLESNVTQVTRVASGSSFSVAASPALPNGPGLTHVTFAPVLPSGLVLLGDTSRWATVSYRRFSQVNVTPTTMSARVIGTPGETFPVAYAPAGSTAVTTVMCTFGTQGSAGCGSPNAHGDVDCVLSLSCTASACTCRSG
eukprot:m.38040 g.38040  ORF g.38040 m.38040 type:complete len:863 (-) comp7769_c0_seq1:47-2635(-)